MKITVAGYDCPVTTKKPGKPVEVQTFEGDEISIEAELVAFAVRFKWYQIVKEEKDG